VRLLTAAEIGILGPAFSNWADLVWSLPQGKVQFLNLAYDFRKRPVARAAILGFSQFLDHSRRYTSRVTKKGRSRWVAALAIAALGEIQNYCRSSTVVPSAPRQAPLVNPLSIAKQVPDDKLARVVLEDKVVSNYMLYAQTTYRVGKPRRIAEAVNWALSKTLIRTSIATRQLLRKRAATASKSGKWVNFFTVASRYPVPPSASAPNRAMFACQKLGLIYQPHDQLALPTQV
jgi:hypothetical protein